MADVRMIAVASVALAACDAAGAAPSPVSGLAAPTGWQSLPAVAQAARDALGTSVTIEGVEAWGEPARGCYAVWLAAAAAGGADRMADDVLAGLKDVVVRDVVKPTTAEGILRLGFTRGVFTGKLAARLGGGRVVALACFANQREPVSCEPGCATLLGAIR